MAKYDIRKLRSRLHWIEDYARGMSGTEILEKYKSEGATERKFRTARKAALAAGLIIPDSGLVGSNFRLDISVFKQLNSLNSVDQSNDAKSLTNSIDNNSHGKNKIEFTESEIVALKQVAERWSSRFSDKKWKNKPESNNDADVHRIQINDELLELCEMYAKKEGLTLDRLVSLALAKYLTKEKEE